MISEIGIHAIKLSSPLMEGLDRVLKNQYDPIERPLGILNLGTAENKLMEEELLKKLNGIIKGEDFLSQDMLYYGNFYGSAKLREKLARFFNKYFKAKTSINADNIVCASGCGSIVCNLAQVLLNPGDKVGVPIPYYGGFDFDLTLYTGAIISKLKDTSDSGNIFYL